MGELTVLTCSLAAVVLVATVLIVAIVTTIERSNSGEMARLRAAIAPFKEAS